MHMIMDGPCSNRAVMRDRVLLAQWLKDTATKADMMPHGEPFIDGFAWPGSDDQEALSGVQFLKESSIVIHTWPECRHAFVDVFSCRDFDEKGMEEHIKKSLGMAPAKVLVLDRGVNPATGRIVSAQVRSPRW